MQLADTHPDVTQPVYRLLARRLGDVTDELTAQLGLQRH
jgi:hypothetical protein